MQNFEPGQLIGGTYKVIDILGEGGMGLVYRVEHIHLTKIFALKVLKTEHLSESVWKRFRVEGLAIARLDHINIVKIYDMAQTADGLPYYTMDLLIGQSLADYIQDNQRLAVRHALPIFRQVCAGLAYAHERGIIHRDIKPGNIMLLASEKNGGDLSNASDIGRCGVKIVDFGIAKMIDDGGLTQGLTRPGEVFGSPLYMSPEQCLGEKLDARSDMYSVGVSLFQALTGRPPLLGKTAVETTLMHQSTLAPMLKDLAPDLTFTADLERVVARMLAKDPADRFASLADVAQELLRMERSDSQNLQPVKNRVAEESRSVDDDISQPANFGGKLLLIAGLLLFVGAGIAAFFLFAEKHTVVVKPARQEDVSLLGIDKMASNKDSETIVSPAEAILVKEFIARKQFFSAPLKPGDTSIVFNFPRSFCIGELHAQGTREIKNIAQGVVIVNRNANLVYQGNKFVCEQPSLLRSFRPSELKGVYIQDCHPRNPALCREVSQLSQLVQVDLSNDQLNNEDLKYLEKLKRLTSLTINYSDITSRALAESSLLPQLHSISVEGMTDIAPLAKQLAKMQISHIDLSTSPLSDQEFEALGKISSLKHLSIRRTGIKAHNLDALLKLHLIELKLADNPLEPAAIEKLQGFKTLKILQITDDLGTPFNIRALKKAIPGLKVEVKVSNITAESPRL